ncbi:MAG: amino acid racemase [Candidatus Shapirobacteria bacterium]
MKNFEIKKIGIIDGMGAFAGAKFFQILLEKINQKGLPFPEIILNAISIDDFIADRSKIIPAKRIISQRIKFFNQQKVSMIVMACNTAHIMHGDLEKIAKCPFPSIIDLVVKKIKTDKIERVGILASPTTLRTKLYEDKLVKSGIVPIVPNKRFQKILEEIIRKVLNGSLLDSDVKEFSKETRKFLVRNQMKGVILGCTELPLAFPKSDFSDIKIFDSLDILADAVVEHLNVRISL